MHENVDYRIFLNLLVAITLTTAVYADNRPNVVLILADDMGWSDLGCYGSEISTPHLDSLAAGGLRFTQFHNTAKCFPSRASLLTGVYAQQCAMNDKPAVIRNAVTLGEVLKASGYRTLMAGKHHGQENPYNRGFDRYYGLRDGCCNYFNPGHQRPGEGAPAHKAGKFFPRTWCIDDQVYAPFTPEEKDFYTTDYFTRAAIGFLEQYRDEGRPFFLYLAYTAPHDPLQAWPADIAKYRGRYSEGFAATRRARYQRQRQSGLIDASFPLSKPTYRDWNSLSAQEKTEQDTIMAIYAAMIDRMDQNIGKLLRKLDDLGVRENTLILFASDNGCAPGGTAKPKSYSPGATTVGEMGSMTRWTKISKSWANVSNTPFRFFKVNAHKGGTCTPMIAHWPKGIQGPGRVIHDPGHFIDFMPTIVEVTGARYPEAFRGERVVPMQGRSLVPVFTGHALAARDTLFWQYKKGKAVRDGQWRLVSDDNGPWELYDMQTDKTETIDLSHEHAEVAQRLQSMHAKWLLQSTLPTINKK